MLRPTLLRPPAAGPPAPAATLRSRQPELVARTDPLAFADALHHAELAQKLLNAHAALATPGAYAQMLSIFTALRHS